MLAPVQYALTVLDGVRWQGEPVAGTRPQTLLAALARANGSPVGDARLIEEVWGDEPPADPTKALQVLVSRTRAACSAELITRTQTGYRLNADTDVDARALAEAVGQTRAALASGAAAEARRLAERALDIPVAASAPSLPEPISDLRAAGHRHRAELITLLGLAQCRVGDHASALATLAPVVERGPVDEAVLAALLHSEAAVRGPAVALQRYEDYRRDLVLRTGTDPGPELKRAQTHLLALDRPVREGVQFEPDQLIGRASDTRAVLGLIGSARVVSIIGPGGLGKTRLAHAIGRSALQPVVQLVELVGITGDDEVITEVASALGVRDSVASRRALTPEQRADLRTRLAQKLSGAPTLLIIDNCEHVIGGVARLVAPLVANLPELTVLTTSRAPLGIAAERTYPLPQLNRTDAVVLFRRRATAARPDAVLDDDQIGVLVDRLDGLPLAVELAAARIRVMSVAEITERLTDRFGLLRSRDPAAPDRHRTLEAVIDWSANLLDEEGRTGLRRLAAFRDGFGRAGAAAVVGGDPVRLLEELADQSLITVEEGATIRYRMLETVREYGLLQQRRLGETAEVDRAVRDWAVDLCRQQYGSLHGTDQYATVDRLVIEEGNLNEALRQAVADVDTDAIVIILATLGGFWWIVGDHQRIVGLVSGVERALTGYDPPDELADATRAAIVTVLVNTVIYYGENTVAAGIELLQRLGPGTADPRIAALTRTMLMLGDDETVQGRIDRLGDVTRSADRDLALHACQWLMHLAENEGAPHEAIEAGERGLRLCRPSDGPWIRAVLLNGLSELQLQLGDWQTGERYAAEAFPIMERLHATDDAAHMQGLLALTAIWAGRLDNAAEQIERLRARQIRTYLHGGDTVLATLDAELAFARGDIATGLQEYREALPRMREFRLPSSMIAEHAPWLLFTESAALCAFHRFGAPDDAERLYRVLLGKLDSYLGPDSPFTDFPIVGTVVFALGTWLSAERPDQAVRLLAYGGAFTVVRTLPSTGADLVLAAVEQSCPGELDRLGSELTGRLPRDLRDEVHALIKVIIAETPTA